MREQLVARTVEVLVEDADRLDILTWDHFVGVVSRRGLDSDEVGDTLSELALRGVTVEREPDGTPAPDDPPARDSSSRLPAGMRRHRILTAEEEVGLGRRIQLGISAQRRLDEGDAGAQRLVDDGLRARDELVRSNLRLVVSIAQRYAGSAGDLDLDDLVQEGTLGLQRAAEKFDPALGYKFSTYATWWVRQSIGRGIDTTGFSIRLPVHICERVRKIGGYARAFESRNGRPPGLREIAEGVDMDAADVQALLDISRPLARLDAPVGDEGGGGTLGELLINDRIPPPDEVVTSNHFSEQVSGLLRAKFDPRSVDILGRRFGLITDEPATLEEIARVHGLTRERVRQIELKLLMTLASDYVIQDLARQRGLRPQPKSPAAKCAADATSSGRAARVPVTSSQESR